MKKLMLLSATAFLCTTPFIAVNAKTNIDASSSATSEAAAMESTEMQTGVSGEVQTEAQTELEAATEADALTPAAGEATLEVETEAAKSGIQMLGDEAEAGVDATATTKIDAN